MSYVKGDSIRFYKGSTMLDLEMEISVGANMDTIESTVKGNVWKTFKSGDKTWTASGSANLDWSQDYNASELFADLKAGNTVGVSIGMSGNYYSGGGIFTKFNIDASHNDLAKISFDLTGSSTLTETSSLSAAIPLLIPFIIS